MDENSKQGSLGRRVLSMWLDAAVRLTPAGESEAWLTVRHTTLHGDLVAP